ncbi:MAG TPA: VOC family protein [Saprospiraceae bacterium]|nr:VOC family protein [Saprospiraceae bacterium]
MTTINTYLTFNGNCREAMNFYQECLGGELFFQAIGESPISEKMPQIMKDCILHSTLTKGDLIIMASDMVGDNGLIIGNSVSLMLNCSSEEEIRSFYKKLSKNGQATHELELSFWGALFGDLVDQYGNQWLLHYEES